MDAIQIEADAVRHLPVRKGVWMLGAGLSALSKMVSKSRRGARIGWSTNLSGAVVLGLLSLLAAVFIHSLIEVSTLPDKPAQAHEARTGRAQGSVSNIDFWAGMAGACSILA